MIKVIDKSVLECLTENVKSKINEYYSINEIRLRKGCPLCLTVGNNNLVTDYNVTDKDIEYSISKFCKNSVYTYFDCIKNGFIPFENGYRIGVCGRAVTENGLITNLSDITAINIRVPSRKFDLPQHLLKKIATDKNCIIYSPPNYGKTTFLRAIIKVLSTPPYNKRISVIDCKNELFVDELHKGCPIDFFFSYPKKKGIDIAVRNMSPEIIICDEIGIDDDIEPLVECKNCGIDLICTAHAKNIGELLKRKNIRKMCELNIFDSFIGISFKNGERFFEFKRKEEISL